MQRRLFLLTGILLYDAAVAVVLGYGAVGLSLTGVLLWPVVLAHLALTLWRLLCIRALAATTPADSGV